MSWAAIVVGGVSLATSAISANEGNKQISKAKSMERADPGYQPNTALITNAQMLGDRYFNYTLPNYDQASQSIDRATEMGYRSVLQGASSSSDILDAATRLAYGNTLGHLNLGEQQVAGQEGALRDYLTANQMAGQEISNANQWEREQYLRSKADAANLENTGLINRDNALQSSLGTISTLVGYGASSGMFGGNGGYTIPPSQQISNVLPGAQVTQNPVLSESVSYGAGYNNNIYIPKRIN